MLLLKLLVIPAFLLLISLAGRRWGPSVAGWLSGLPVVVGPILLFLALEQGEAFAAQSATAALSAMFAMIAFCVVYARVAQHRDWPWALGIALGVWALVAMVLSWLPASLPLSSVIAIVALLAAPYLFPTVRPVMTGPAPKSDKLLLRMVAGALLTLAVTLLASTVGERWSGLLAVFPVLGSVMAVFSQQTRGAAFTAALLRATATGMYCFSAFCLTLALTLPVLGMPAFVVSVAVSVVMLLVTRRLLVRASAPRANDVAHS
ncbi:hypothetical protein PSH58_09935 [Pseudomonas hefeiensis]|uniref:Uncharacterized protein n=1 Tax=Pseudomonas hefeiensis TaxID=2738125 RepID=A0ABY9GG68_9PSED|nr:MULTISPECIES: hypothetical protein [unclassified Pseudomonas]WLH14598.1 hypothetical protein PSH57_09930 [Pseudomonas sp. FP205]WLH97656.1 hypothetical protein PSH58_09935 [Pseudomonas sp. FP53]WLI41927.1 hypothetical protein PSH74_09915 [Pseudomonas sp. FP821]